MDLKGNVAMFPCDMNTVEIVNVATGLVVQQHEAQGTLDISASVQKNVAAMAIREPYHGALVMNLESGRILSKFILSNGHTVIVSLSKDTQTLTVGSSTGFS
jgi:hypothetical protein